MKYLKSINEASRSDYYSRVYTHPNSNEERHKILTNRLGVDDIDKISKSCGIKFKKHGVLNYITSEHFPINRNISIDYIEIYPLEDEWYVVIVEYYKNPKMFKCDQLDGLKIFMDDLRKYGVLY
jgi:hypothetical protein